MRDRSSYRFAGWYYCLAAAASLWVVATINTVGCVSDPPGLTDDPPVNDGDDGGSDGVGGLNDPLSRPASPRLSVDNFNEASK